MNLNYDSIIKPPNNERKVLAWVRDSGGLEYWQIDSFDKEGGWFEAVAWDQEVLYWQDLPEEPEW